MNGVFYFSNDPYKQRNRQAHIQRRLSPDIQRRISPETLVSLSPNTNQRRLENHIVFRQISPQPNYQQNEYPNPLNINRYKQQITPTAQYQRPIMNYGYQTSPKLEYQCNKQANKTSQEQKFKTFGNKENGYPSTKATYTKVQQKGGNSVQLKADLFNSLQIRKFSVTQGQEDQKEQSQEQPLTSRTLKDTKSVLSIITKPQTTKHKIKSTKSQANIGNSKILLEISQLDNAIQTLNKQKQLLRSLLQKGDIEQSNYNFTSSISSSQRLESQLEYSQTNRIETNKPSILEQSQALKENYIGSHENQERHGYGTLYDSQGKIIYEGEWKNSSYHGRGRLFNQDQQVSVSEKQFLEDLHCTQIGQCQSGLWTIYEGEIQQGKFSGLGILHLQAGLKFHGNFLGGLLQGRGTLVNQDRRNVLLVSEFKDGFVMKVIYQNFNISL